MKELLVFQAGGNANRLFVPFWNIQTEYLTAEARRCPPWEVLWQDVALPRLLALDNKDRIYIPGVRQEEEALQWVGQVRVYSQEPVKSWSQDLRFRLHPKNVIPTSQEDFSPDLLEDRLRLQTEQCDCVQGALLAGDTDWSWATLCYFQLFYDSYPKLPTFLLTFQPLESPLATKAVADLIVKLSDYSHLLHVPSLWDAHTEDMQRMAPAILTENITLPFRVSPFPDMRQSLTPLLLNSSSNFATSLCNLSDSEQLLLGIPPTSCSTIQRLFRGQGHEIAYGIPPVSGWERDIREYETVYARTAAFAEWIDKLAEEIRKSARDDDTLEAFECLSGISENYSSS